jgi:hypothetical protein
LEEKQRLARKYKEVNKIEHVPYYFEEVPVAEDNNQPYWKYSHKYFEHDREAKNWGHLEDIYSTENTPEL